MTSRRESTGGARTTILNFVLILFVILPFTIAGIWAGIRIHTSIFPPDPDVMMPPFPDGIAFVLFLGLGLLIGGLLGGFVWAAIAKQFMTRDEVYQHANFGVRIPVVTSLNKAYLRWLFSNEGKKR